MISAKEKIGAGPTLFRGGKNRFPLLLAPVSRGPKKEDRLCFAKSSLNRSVTFY